MTHSMIDLALRLVVAAALGSVIGLERERKSWSAGLRTHMLVALSSALIMIVSMHGFSEVLGEHVVLDPSRVAAQVVSGIGFLGAGAILLRGEIVRGLTTAASLWAVAAIGLAVGSGLYVPAVIATILILIILAGIKPLEARYHMKHQAHDFVVIADPGTVSIEALSAAVRPAAVTLRQYVALRDPSTDLDEIRITLGPAAARDLAEIEKRLRALPGVRDVE